MTGPPTQLLALLRLRWHMTRAPGVRVGVVVAALALGVLLHSAVAAAELLIEPAAVALTEIAAPTFLGFTVLALIAPLAAGGGQQVVPANELVAFPVRPATVFLGGVLLAPLNLVWVVHLVGLVTVTGVLAREGSLPHALVLTAAYVALVTALGQVVAWAVCGIRQSRTGRRVLVAAAVAGPALVLLAGRLGHGEAVLAASQVPDVVTAVERAAATSAWHLPLAVMLVLTAALLALGTATCAWALRRPPDRRHEPWRTRVRRRHQRHDQFWELVALDRASVWRAVPLRRGLLFLAVLPGLFAFAAQLPWASITLLPGLVAASAGLLFGVNAFALDASGAVWLASLPQRPAVVAAAKATVLAETVTLAVLAALVPAILRAPTAPTTTQLAALAASAVASVAVVVALCLRASVRHPHRAELDGPRDAVVPPVALALQSARLALPAAAVGIVVVASAQTFVWWVPVAVATPVVCLALLAVLEVVRRYDDDRERARVMQVVASG